MSARASITTLIATGAGTVPAGTIQVSFGVTGATAATVNGQTLPAGASVSFGKGDRSVTLPEMAYNATGTSLRVDYVSI